MVINIDNREEHHGAKQNIRRLTESEARLRSIVDAAVDGIIVIDAGGIVGVQPGRGALFRL
jgi:PAS domain-containing protein